MVLTSFYPLPFPYTFQTPRVQPPKCSIELFGITLPLEKSHHIVFVFIRMRVFERGTLGRTFRRFELLFQDHCPFLLA